MNEPHKDDDGLISFDLETDLGFSSEEIELLNEAAAEEGITLNEYINKVVEAAVRIGKMKRDLGIAYLDDDEHSGSGD
jgi:hypothetical protein